MGNIDTLLKNGILIPHWWVKKIPFPKWVSEFPTKLNQWGKRIPFLKRVSIFPTSGKYRYRFQNRYRYCPLVGKKDTDSKMGIEIPRQAQPVGRKDTVSQNGIDIPHQAPLVGKKDTVSQNGIDTPHQWG